MPAPDVPPEPGTPPDALPERKGWWNRFGWLILIWAAGVGFMALAVWLLKLMLRLATAQ